MSKKTVESKRAALLAKQRMLLEEQATLRVTPSWDTKAHEEFVARLTKYENGSARSCGNSHRPVEGQQTVTTATILVPVILMVVVAVSCWRTVRVRPGARVAALGGRCGGVRRAFVVGFP